MLIYPKKKIVFVHAPRTSGNYIYSLVKDNPEYIVMLGKFQHATSKEVSEALPDYNQVTILRNPYDIFASHYNMCCAVQEQGTNFEFINYTRYCKTELGPLAHVEHLIKHSMLCQFGGFSETYYGKGNTNDFLLLYDTDSVYNIRSILDIPYKKSDKVKWYPDRFSQDVNVLNLKRIRSAIAAFCYHDFDWYYDAKRR